MKKIFLIAGLCAGLLVLSGCGGIAAQQGGQQDLTGTMWSLSTFMGKELVPGSGITAEFTTDDKISGSSGCNLYAGAYQVDGNNILISSPLASTMMACSQEIMDQETAYLKALGDVRNFVSLAGSADVQGCQWERPDGLHGPDPGPGRDFLGGDRLQQWETGCHQRPGRHHHHRRIWQGWHPDREQQL